MQLIPLTQGFFAKVDDEDYERLAVHNWYLHCSRGSTRYAVRWRKNSDPRVGSTIIRMHHEILGIARKPGTEVDHIDWDGLNNQKANLRITTRSGNARNQKRYARCNLQAERPRDR